MSHLEILNNATSAKLEKAAALNHRELFGLEALALGGTVLTAGGLCWTMAGHAGASMISFPDLPDDTAGTELDRVINSYLQYPPAGAGCWSLDPTQPKDLGVLLLARGFQPGWRPRWMALDLQELPVDEISPKGLHIEPDNLISPEELHGVPYARIIRPVFSSGTESEKWTRFVGILKGKKIAQSVVFLSSGPFGVAGIYNVGVSPRSRRKGIGMALTIAACRYAREKGYRYAVLNATDLGRLLYERMGFVCVGEGWTWWLITERLLAQPPTSRQTALAEAVGRGDQAALEAIVPSPGPAELNATITNGMTLLELAVHCQQPVAAEWLVEHGATFSVLAAWDLGWKERARQGLADHPGQVDQVYGEFKKTLLHVAAERNDEDLCRLALLAGADRTLKDSTYQSTALGWARHFGNDRIGAMIEKE